MLSQARRSCLIPYFMFSISVVWWASVLMTILQPASLAIRRSRSHRSRRLGLALCSTATPAAGGSFEDAGHVDLVGVAAEELASGGVAEDADVGVLDGAEDAVGHLFEGLVEEGVDAGDDDVHLGEGFVGEVELAVVEDVDFDSREYPDFSFHFGSSTSVGSRRCGPGRVCRRGRWSWRGSWSGR